MTAVVEPTEVIDLSAFDEPTIPCEAESWHEQYGDGPAKWVIFWKPLLPCGCEPFTSTLMCDGCWQHGQRVHWQCPTHHRNYTTEECVVRVEAL